MQFLLVKSKDVIVQNDKEQIKKIFEKNSSIVCDYNSYEWASNDNHTFFIGKNPKIDIYEKYSVFDIDDENNFSFINGWLKKIDEDELLHARDIHNLNSSEKLDGFFNSCTLDYNGSGNFYSSIHSPPLYYASDEDKFAISNRIHVLSELFGYDEFNMLHIATHITYQHLALTFDTFYEKIYEIPFGSSVSIKDSLLIKKNYDFYFNKRLDEKYKENPKEYWDECYKMVSSQAKAFKNLGIENFEQGISGGLDSRLLLSIFHENISSLYTWGPPYSPEVIAGRMVAEKLKLPHKVPFFKKGPDSRNLLNYFTLQLFSTEFEMCPWDSGFLNYNTSNKIKVDGQEFIKVSPYYNHESSVEEVLKILEEEITSRKFIIPDEFYHTVLDKHLSISKEYLYYQKYPSKFSVIKKVLSRGRWVARVHEIIFDHAFNIYPLLTNTMIQYAYNSSFESMTNNEIVFEMIKRSCPELLDVPFFNNSLLKHPIPPLQNKIPNKTNYKYEYLVLYFEHLKKFMLDNYGLISNLVKKDFIETLTPERILRSESIAQSVYNILLTIILFKSPNTESLKKMLDYDFKIDERKVEDTYNEDCLLAFVEYNQDIVNLKIENKKYKDELNILKNIKSQNKLNNYSFAECNAFKLIFPQNLILLENINFDENKILFKSASDQFNLFIDNSSVNYAYSHKKVGTEDNGFLLIDKQLKKITGYSIKYTASIYNNKYILNYFFDKFDVDYRVHVSLNSKKSYEKFISDYENEILSFISNTIISK